MTHDLCPHTCHVSQWLASLIKFIGPGSNSVSCVPPLSQTTGSCHVTFVTCHETPRVGTRGNFMLLCNMDHKRGLFSIKILWLYLSRFKICRFMISFVAEILRSAIGREQRSIIIKLLKHSQKNYTQLLHLSSWSSLVNKINKYFLGSIR